MVMYIRKLSPLISGPLPWSFTDTNWSIRALSSYSLREDPPSGVPLILISKSSWREETVGWRTVLGEMAGR